MNKTQLLEMIKKFVSERDWEQFHDPKNLALSLNLESSEVLELFQWTKNNEIDSSKADKIPDELADVYYWLLLLADYYKIDLDQALEDKLMKNKSKYPINKSKGKPNKYTDL